mmetsp:Transcript_11440/g.31610  ORF Transcript_11440/g.31610 Transcript_11440/m.31610 type:complete len:90 (-) Transcript_11440:2892-3161(-)
MKKSRLGCGGGSVLDARNAVQVSAAAAAAARTAQSFLSIMTPLIVENWLPSSRIHLSRREMYYYNRRHLSKIIFPDEACLSANIAFGKE